MKKRCTASTVGERREIVTSVAPACCCHLGNVSIPCSNTSCCREGDAVPLCIPALLAAGVCEVPLSQTGVLVRRCCLHCLLCFLPSKNNNKKIIIIRVLICISENGFCLFCAALRFQNDPRVYLLALRGVVWGGIPLLPQNQPFTVSWVDPQWIYYIRSETFCCRRAAAYSFHRNGFVYCLWFA